MRESSACVCLAVVGLDLIAGAAEQDVVHQVSPTLRI